MPKASRCPLIRFGRAVRFVRAIDGAVEVGLRGPLHIVRHDQIEFAVAIVIDPDSAGRELVRTPEPRGFGHVRKRAVAVVVEEMALADSSNKDVVEAIVVVVADRDAHPKKRNVQARPARHVGEGPVVIIVVKLQRGRAAFGAMGWMAGPVLAVDQQDVRESVVVVIDEGAAGTHGFRKPLLSEGSVVVGEMDAGLRGDVAEADGLCGCEARHD